MRKLFARYSSDPPPHGRLLLSLVRFFLHHGQPEMYDIETPIRAYFGQVLTAKFNELVVHYDGMPPLHTYSDGLVFETVL